MQGTATTAEPAFTGATQPQAALICPTHAISGSHPDDDGVEKGEDTQEVELRDTAVVLRLHEGSTYNGSTLRLDRGVLRNDEGEWIPANALVFNIIAARVDGFSWTAKEENGRRSVLYTGYPTVNGNEPSLPDLLTADPNTFDDPRKRAARQSRRSRRRSSSRASNSAWYFAPTP
jgi:hypothetical protein